MSRAATVAAPRILHSSRHLLRFVASGSRRIRPLGTVYSSQDDLQNTHPKERIMNIAKHMESIFLAAAVIGAATSYASAADADATRLALSAPVSQMVVHQAKMPVVVVAAKRLTAAEKAAL
jgi:hypothetical protein